MKEYIILNIYSISDWNINGLIQFFGQHVRYFPDKWGPFEPAEFDFDLSDLPDMIYHWENSRGFLLEKKDPHYQIQLVSTIKGKRVVPNWLNMTTNPEHFLSEQNVSEFTEFIGLLFEKCNGLYGYACHNKSFEQKNKISRPTMIAGKLISTASYPIINCLPGIYWANLFGNLYIEYFGKEKIQTTPCSFKNELDNNSYLILSGKTPLDYESNLQTESSIINHLGKTAFFDINDPARSCHPTLDSLLHNF